MTWQPSADEYGIAPMIAASLLATAGAALLGGLIGLMCALLLADVAPKILGNVIRPLINLLAGIPSVVYGFFGLMVVVPWITATFGGTGNSLLAVILILSAMILPTMVSLSETAVRAVPQAYREGSLALGATKMQTLFKVTLPCGQERRAQRHRAVHRPRHRRDHGGHPGGGQPRRHAALHPRPPCAR